MGFHPKNDLHKCMKVRLSIWTLWICVSKKNSGNDLKTENCKKLKVKWEKVNFEDLGHQLDKLGHTCVLGFYPRVMTCNL